MDDSSVAKRLLSFWPLQSAGWTLYALLRFISFLPFARVPGEMAYQAAFVFTCVTASFLLYVLCHRLWHRGVSLPRSLLVMTAAAYPIGILCMAAALIVQQRVTKSRTPFHWSWAVAGGSEPAVILLAWGALYFGIKHYLRSEEQKRLLLAAQLTLRDSQLATLRYQLQPHFLFNTLNAVSSLIVSQQPDLATRVLSKLAGLLRTTLDGPEVHSVTLEEELLVAEEYLSIERIRFGHRLAVDVSIPPHTRECQVPRFILQPLLENAMKHGVSRRSRGGSVSISATKGEAWLHLSIENDMAEGAAGLSGQGHGVGLRNTRERIKQIYGESGEMTTLVTEEGRFCVLLKLPLRMQVPSGPSVAREAQV